MAPSPKKNNKNPLLQEQEKFLASVPCESRTNFFSPTHLTAERRAEIWTQQAELGETLVEKYAWATPDDRAIKIISHFGPIIEIGAGQNGYWARHLRAAGVDVLAYDRNSSGGDGDEKEDNTEGNDADIKKGGPEVLKGVKDRALFLCYPDEDPFEPDVSIDEDGNMIDEGEGENENKEKENANDKGKGKNKGEKDKGASKGKGKNESENKCKDEEEGEDDDEVDSDEEMGGGFLVLQSLGSACLEYYEGDTVIHVGELYGDTLSLSQAPWGRSSGAEFQERLAGEYHCILKVTLPNWIHVRDTLSVWKRSEKCSIVFKGGDDGDDEDSEEEEVEYKHIPLEERLPVDVAAPCVAHLLGKNVDESSKKRKK